MNSGKQIAQCASIIRLLGIIGIVIEIAAFIIFYGTASMPNEALPLYIFVLVVAVILEIVLIYLSVLFIKAYGDLVNNSFEILELLEHKNKN